MTTTTTTKKPRTAQPETASVHDLIVQTFAGHAEYHSACEKLKELQAKLAQVQSEFDQVNASAQTDVAELADRILAGDELTEREQVFARRQALSQRIEAYKAAVAKQTTIAGECRNDACRSVQQVIEPIYEERFERLIASLKQLEAAKDAMAEVQRELTTQSVRHGISLLTMAPVETAIRQVLYICERAQAARQPQG